MFKDWSDVSSVEGKNVAWCPPPRIWSCGCLKHARAKFAAPVWDVTTDNGCCLCVSRHGRTMICGSGVQCVDAGCVARGDWMPLKSQGKTSPPLTLCVCVCVCVCVWGGSVGIDPRPWSAAPSLTNVPPYLHLPSHHPIWIQRCVFSVHGYLATRLLPICRRLCPALRFVSRWKGGMCQQV